MGTGLWPTDKIFLMIFIVFSMMSITLQVTLRQIAAVLRDRTLVMRALIINFVLVLEFLEVEFYRMNIQKFFRLL